MDALDRVVGSLSCRQVLHALSDWLDDELSAERVAAVQEHLAGCDTCAQFGGRVSDAVRALRAHTGVDAAPTSAVQRIRAAIAGA